MNTLLKYAWATLALLLMVCGGATAVASNTLPTNSFGLQYDRNTFTNDTSYFFLNGMLIAGSCNADAQIFQDARAAGTEVLQYIAPVDIPDAALNTLCPQETAFYTGEALWPYPTNNPGSRVNYMNHHVGDIRANSSWADKVVQHVEDIITAGKVDGVFVDVLGGRLWSPVSDWANWPADEQRAYGEGAVNLIQRLDDSRRRLNPRFIIINNNTWSGNDPWGMAGEMFVDGVCLEHHDATPGGFNTLYASHAFGYLGHRRMVSIGTSTSDAQAWAQVQGVTHVSDQAHYPNPGPPPLSRFNALADRTYMPQFFGTMSTVGATPSSGLNADFKRGSKFTLSQSGTLHGLSAYLDGGPASTSGSQQVRMELYADSSGVPGSKVAVSSGDPVTINGGQPAGWVHFAAPATTLTAGTYWIVIHSGGTTGIARDYGVSGGNWYANSDPFSSGGSNPFGTGTSGSTTLSAYAEFTPDAHVAGRTTIGSTPSGGLQTNFKRGSQFTVSQAGTLYSLSAYLDGAGGGSGSQQIRMELYRDSSGVPGTRVVQSGIALVYAGDPAKWVTFATPPTALTAGTYWIVIHSGDSNAVARDYGGDGANNWYGNADTFSDGGTDPFGTGTTGTGTLSAYATYY